MKTLARLAANPSIPAAIAWNLNDLGASRGRHELWTKQSPEKLLSLREHAIIESAVSSNRIEGVEIEADRVQAIITGEGKPMDRAEEEVRGYRNALILLHEKGAQLGLDERVILDLHRLTRGEVWDAGAYREKDGDILERYPDGRRQVRFRIAAAAETPALMKLLVENWKAAIEEHRTPPLLALAAFNLDFLCIHPFREGNSRVSHLLFLMTLYQLGFEVGRYISLEQLIEENIDRHYETLEESAKGWHEGRHDYWPYVGFLLSVLTTAHRHFEDRIGLRA